jgi:hypothetical protein
MRLALLLICSVGCLVAGQPLTLAGDAASGMANALGPLSEAPFNATHGRPRALQLNDCGVHPVERQNQRFGVDTGNWNRNLLCDGGVGISYDLTVRTNPRGGGDRLAYYPTMGPSCGQNFPSSYALVAGQPATGLPGISTQNPIVFSDAPCANFAGGPTFSNPCCMLILCTTANLGVGCEYWVDLLWYIQLAPFFTTSNDIQGASFPTSGSSGFATGFTATFRRTLGGTSPTGSFVNSFTISNPNAARLTIYTVSGTSCNLLPWANDFNAPPDSQRDTELTSIQGTASCPSTGQCCTIVKCHRDNWGAGCQGLSYTGTFLPAAPSPSPSAPPLLPPTVSETCTQATLPPLQRAGAPLSALCFEPAPLQSHDFFMANPNFHRITVFLRMAHPATRTP